MAPENPYAPPTASLEPHSEAGCWRDGRILVARPGAVLPSRCVKCGDPAEEPLKPRKFYWHHPAFYLIALVALLLYVIVAMIVRKEGTVSLGLCPRHRKRRLAGQLLGWLGFLLGMGLMITGAAQDSCGVAVAGLVAMLGCLVAGVILARLVHPERIDKDFIRLRGCGEAFLQGLPDFHG
ncbi:MAG: hypothetical protein U0P81_03815 [Holophagaceae bacterium]